MKIPVQNKILRVIGFVALVVLLILILGFIQTVVLQYDVIENTTTSPFK